LRSVSVLVVLLETKLKLTFFLQQAYKEGYEPVEDDFTVAENHVAQINITLYKTVSRIIY
jgi:hypothetical protein